MRVVEAGARKICYERDHPSELTEYPYGCRACVVLAEETLDAILDCLAESVDEWADYPAEAETSVWAHRAIIARKLVKALREDR